MKPKTNIQTYKIGNRVVYLETSGHRDTVVPIVGAVVAVAPKVIGIVKKLGPIIGKIFKKKKKTPPEYWHQKVAASINAFKALGYTVNQLQAEPLRTIIDGFANFPVDPATFRDNAPAYIMEVMADVGPDFPEPESNPSAYQIPGPKAAVDPIIAEIYGPNFPKYGKTPITAATFAQFPSKLIPEVPITSDRAKNIAQSAITTTSAQQQEQTKTTDEQSIITLRPFVPMMQAALRDQGVIAPNSVTDTASLFYENIVQPATGNGYDSDFLDEAITNAILEFIGTLQAKKAAGEQLPKVYDVIATGANRVVEAGGAAVEKRAAQTIGMTIMDFMRSYGIWVGGAVLLLLIFFFMSKRK